MVTITPVPPDCDVWCDWVLLQPEAVYPDAYLLGVPAEGHVQWVILQDEAYQVLLDAPFK